METQTQAAPTLEKGRKVTITDNGEEREAVILDNTSATTAIVGFRSNDGFYHVDSRTFTGHESANEGERALEKLKESAALIFDKIRNSLVVLETAAKTYAAQTAHQGKGEIPFPMHDDDHWAKAKKMILENPYALTEIIINTNRRLVEAMRVGFEGVEEVSQIITELQETLVKEHELFEQAKAEFDGDVAKANDALDITLTQKRLEVVNGETIGVEDLMRAMKAREALNGVLDA